jgi:NADH:ubiquinone oxidoreductase subunit F (NADH-binding)/Pyruvate/2-oxoacid:ferredoxin oxidoreductase delta subunit
MRTSSLIAPCCDRCTHRPGSPCRDLIKCISEGPVCHDSDACRKSRQDLLAKVRRGGEGTLIFVGAGTCGRANGSTKVIARIVEFLAQNKIAAEIIETGCVGYCQRELFVDVQLPDSPRIAYADINPGNIDQLLDEVFIKKNLRNSFMFARHGEAGPNWSDIPEINSTDFFKRQVKVVLRNAGIIDPSNLDAALAAGAFKSAARALCSMTPEEVCNEVLASGLRGRGGAGFPTGQKWNIARQTPRAQKYLICNADEGDPGAFMDRAVLESDPFFVIEGMLIAAYAIGASKGYIYCRAEYPLAIERLTQAIAQLRRVGLLGNNILGSLFSFDITIKQGAGAFVCGEETAILASIEGGRGMPRPRPPYPAIAGLHGKPTVLNNVETLANVPVIIDRGAQYFQDLGLGKAAGTKVFALSGTICNTGLVEVPVGIKLRTIVEDIGGGSLPGHKIKSVQMGGPSGGCVPAEYFDTPTDYGTLIELGAMMGSGGMVVMDERTCMVDVARFFMEFIRNESCGKCTPCREGTTRMLEILTSITERPVGNEEKRLERIRGVLHLQELASTVKEASLCGLGQTAANPVLSTLRYFRHEYEAHVIDQRCPAGQCQGLAVYEVDNATCIGCLMCKKSCPSNAIVGERKQAHYIIVDRCIGCGTCVTACPKHSIHMVQPGEEERASV